MSSAQAKKRLLAAAVARRLKDLPLSGYEPLFDPELWDTEEGVRTANCYSFSLDDYDTRRTQKAMPGARAKQTSSIDYTKCDGLKRRLLADNPGAIYHVDPKAKCAQGHFKIMMFVDSTGGSDKVGDFHFYKQHRDVLYKARPGDTCSSIARFFGVPTTSLQNMTSGSIRAIKEHDRIFVPNANVWSHKLGVATGALLKDSCGRAIKDPRRACRKYGFHYDRFCGSYCVKRNRVHSR